MMKKALCFSYTKASPLLSWCHEQPSAGVLALAIDNMEGKVAASEKLIRHSQSLCAGEEEYVRKRKQVVLEALSSLEINSTADSVPHIALLASGGGQRAAVGMVGSLYQMKKDGLLNTLLYLGTISGSTWSMASTYSDPQWSNNMDRAVDTLSGPGVDLEQALAWLKESAKDEYFSLTDVFAVLVAAGIMKQMDLSHLSDEANRNVTNPYPIYTAIEKTCFSDGPIEGKWFEVSPHEAGFTELGLFVETSLLGSKFQNGKLLEQKPEMDMVKLQGVFGSVLADEDSIIDFIPAWMNVDTDSDLQEFPRVYNILIKLIHLIRNIVQDRTALAELDKLQKIQYDMVNLNHSALLEGKSPEERKALSQQWSLELLAAVETWDQNLEAGTFKTQVLLLMKQVIPLIRKWEWGTTGNFLYQYNGTSIPDCLYSQERFHLIDGGLLINMPYPSFLGDKRDIDLIISPEYSAGDMFETLTVTRAYAAELKKPFPEIDDKILEDRDLPKDCYVFDGKGKAPTIVYMPLFNRRNCKDAEEYKAKMEEFSTFQLGYSQQMIETLLDIAKANMENNKEILLREISKAARRRQNKRAGLVCQSNDACLFGLV